MNVYGDGGFIVYQTVANKLGHGLYMRQDKKFLWVNESFAKIFGYSQDEILTKNYFDLIFPEDFVYMIEMISQFNRGEIEQMSIEVRGMKKDGSLIDISVSNKRILFEGKPTSIGSVIDISDRKKMELDLKESKDRYRILVESSPIGILVHQRGIVEYVNPVAVNLLGAKTSKDLIGQSIYTFVHYDFKAIVSKRINNIENLGVSVPPIFQKFIRLDGSEIDVEVSGNRYN
jgi:PAS domain S-box-containing protein